MANLNGLWKKTQPKFYLSFHVPLFSVFVNNIFFVEEDEILWYQFESHILFQGISTYIISYVYEGDQHVKLENIENLQILFS